MIIDYFPSFSSIFARIFFCMWKWFNSLSLRLSDNLKRFIKRELETFL